MEKKVSILYIGNTAEAINELSTHPDISLTHGSHWMAAKKLLKSGYRPDAILCEQIVLGGTAFSIHEEIRLDPEQAINNIAFILICHEFKEDIFKKAFNKDMRPYNLAIDDFYVLPLPDLNGLVNRIRFLVEYRKKEKEVPEWHMPLIKIVFDKVVASIALLAVSPILLIAAMAIRIESKGKVYYTSKRMGHGLEAFEFYKLRSMRVGAEAEHEKLSQEKNQYMTADKFAEIDFDKECPRCKERTDGTPCSVLLECDQDRKICDYNYAKQKEEIFNKNATFVKISNDPRVTRVGKFIRNTSIDELPQLINVIIGDMSIVGNRPLPLKEAHQLTKGLIAKRFHAPAGITGLWQVELRGKGGQMSETERKKLDNDYADHFSGNKYSFRYDLKLIFRTAKALFQKDSV